MSVRLVAAAATATAAARAEITAAAADADAAAAASARPWAPAVTAAPAARPPLAPGVGRCSGRRRREARGAEGRHGGQRGKEVRVVGALLRPWARGLGRVGNMCEWGVRSRACAAAVVPPVYKSMGGVLTDAVKG